MKTLPYPLFWLAPMTAVRRSGFASSFDHFMPRGVAGSGR